MKKGLLLLMWALMTWSMLTGCSSNGWTAPTGAADTVEVGDTIKVDYIGTLDEDGTVFDTSLEAVAKENDLFAEERPYEPLGFTVGARQMIPGFDAGVVGMKLDETKNIKVQAADGYGERTEEAIQEVPTEMFAEAGIVPAVGEQIVLNSPMGPIPGTVIEVGSGTTTVDMNHFLAGKTISFEATIKEITKGTGEIPAEAPIEAPVVAPEEVAEAEDTAEAGE